MACSPIPPAASSPTNVRYLGRQLLGRCRLQRQSSGPAGQRRQRVCDDREHGAFDSGFGAARQRHGPQGSAAVDHGRQQSEQRHRQLQREHTDRHLRANAGYVGPASFTYTITDGQAALARAMFRLQSTTRSTAQSLFNPSDTPATVTRNDPSSVELGVKFQASTNGTITGIRFYKGPQNTGTHVADLWSSTGTLLATATFTNETASGWQQVNLSQPCGGHGGDDLRGVLPYQRKLLGNIQLFRHRAYQWVTDGARQRNEWRRWRFCLWHRLHLPHQQLQRQQLLGSMSFSTALPCSRRSPTTTAALTPPRIPRCRFRLRRFSPTIRTPTACRCRSPG